MFEFDISQEYNLLNIHAAGFVDNKVGY